MRMLALVIAAVFVGACSPAAPSTHKITGTIQWPGVNSVARGGECAGAAFWGTEDLQTGVQVLLVDEAGKTIGASQLENTTPDPNPAAACSGQFSMEQVPDASFYQLRFGIRKTDLYSRADLEARGWKLDLAINVQ